MAKPAMFYCMVGEGLGRHDTDPVYNALFEEKPEILGVGDVIFDKMVQLEDVPDETVESWEEQDWYPDAGESVKAKVPEIDKYVEKELPAGRSMNQSIAVCKAGAKAGFAGQSDRPIDHDVIYDLEVADGIAEAYVFVEECVDNRISCTKTQDLTGPDYIEGLENKGVFDDLKYLLVSNGESDEMLDSLFSTLEEHNTDVIFDPAPVKNAEKFFEQADYITPNEAEYEKLEFETDATVIKTSSEGAEVEGYQVEAPEVDPVDTTGAGDVFNGYLAAGLSQGLDVEEAMEDAVYAASLSVTEQGAQPSIPDEEAVNTLKP